MHCWRWCPVIAMCLCLLTLLVFLLLGFFLHATFFAGNIISLVLSFVFHANNFGVFSDRYQMVSVFFDIMKNSILTTNQSQNQIKSMYRISKIPSDNISSSTYSFHDELIHLAVVRHTPSASRLTAEANGTGAMV